MGFEATSFSLAELSLLGLSLSEFLTLATLVVATVAAVATVIQTRLMLYNLREPYYRGRRLVDLSGVKPWMIRTMDRRLDPLRASMRTQLAPHMTQPAAAALADDVVRAAYAEIIGRVEAAERFHRATFRWELRKAVDRHLLAELVRRQAPESPGDTVHALP
ncbi:hypothetical protein [Virgisporangium aurantiacum]|uniref:Uncharacterized protein n=1 Tax=Virgisporangium aurantiacum TaxID=175570 RepID=A0A8J4E019_9ACTN|nr:hypothetical protein [Virgisporangium aurantiacum]GIJ56173.1 hypothetical protein Vau01_036890 [Virgisporangium aurantiacum]